MIAYESVELVVEVRVTFYTILVLGKVVLTIKRGTLAVIVVEAVGPFTQVKLYPLTTTRVFFSWLFGLLRFFFRVY